MSVLGKVLIFFNLLAAGAFAYFTLEDWKLRQELTTAAVSRQLVLDGLYLEPQNPAPIPDDVGEDRQLFQVELPSGKLTSIRKDLYEKIIPGGGTLFGGGPVATQTEEVTRVQKKLQETLAAEKKNNPARYFDWMQAYLLGLARTGAERDGVNALFDLGHPQVTPQGSAREESARRDLAHLGRTPSQVAALQTIFEIASLRGIDSENVSDETRATRIKSGRDAVVRLLDAERYHAAGGADKADDERKLKDAIVAVTRDRAGEAEKTKLLETVTVAEEKKAWGHLANVAVEPLADKASREKAINALLAFVQEKATTDTERSAYAGVKNLIYRPDLNAAPEATVEAAGLDLINAKFDDAALPAGTQATGAAGEKARKIAHVLYHVDAWRHRGDANQLADRKLWHERVATVVGMPNYIKAAEAQASEYAEASQRLIAAITEEQSAFEAEYQTQLQQVLFLYNQWLTLENQYKAQEVVTNENVRLMMERKTEKDNLVTALMDATQKAIEWLAKLQKTQAALFAVQKDLRDAQEALLTLEKELRRLELGK